MTFQKTLSTKVEFSGIGIHSGTYSKVILHPAPIDYGIKFYLREHMSSPDKAISATIDNIRDSSNGFSTSLEYTKEVYYDVPVPISKQPNVTVFLDTIEHLMAALYFAEITNCMVEIVNGHEIPILDGSSWDILKLIFDQENIVRVQYVPKIITQMAEVKPFVVDREYKVKDGDSYITLSPSSAFSVTVQIDFSERSKDLIGNQVFVYEPQKTTAIYNQCAIACARTFGFYSDMQKLHKAGRGLGAGLENCIVVDEATDEIMNDFDLHWHNEFVRHKLVDLLGDLMLYGRPIIGHIYAYKPSHRLTQELIRNLP
jgi:UDP-3-O-[3-hydroxymyristoyl] N-acetylglucosamine deacetylase